GRRSRVARAPCRCHGWLVAPIAERGLSCASSVRSDISFPRQEVAMSGMRTRLALVAALVGVLVLAADPAAAQKKTLVIALNQDPDVLDPTLSRTYVGRIIYAQMCEKLYEIDESLRIVPQLAAELPALSDGGKTVTIKLKPRVKFND